MKNPTLVSALDTLWLGSEASFLALMALEAQVLERMSMGPAGMPASKDEQPYLLNVQDGIGFIRIHGSLTNRESPWNQCLGITSYGAIREAVIAAASNPDVKEILLDINSGGGAANGVSDVGQLIRTVNDNVKPVTAFTDGSMSSAAYWLGSSAGKVYATKMSSVGSIGVIATHMEYSKQLKDDGVTATVMRAGKYKALVNSIEPLTAEAKARLEKDLQAAYKVFVDHVGEMRNHSSAYVDEHMAQGQDFFGEAALDAGLVDGITSFDALVSELKKKCEEANSTPRNLNTGVTMKQALTTQGIAALAAGAPAVAASATASAPAAPDTPATPETPQVEAAAAPVAAAAAAAPVAAQPNPEILSFVQGQLGEANAKLLDAHIQIKSLQDELAAKAATFGPLTELAGKSLNNLRVALNSAVVDVTKMAPEALLAAHAQASAEFDTKFKVGGVAAVDAVDAVRGQKVGIDPMHAARLAANAAPTARAK